jgi:aerobic carbon-monoxide dehydrogenase medium subunit
MIPSSFNYEMAESVEEAIALLGSKEDAKLLAGGHSLLPLMKTRLARPATLVDIGRVKGLAGVSDGGDHLVVGALTRHHDLATSALARGACPILSDTASQIGDPQVRHMGTIGGSVAHGDPASDLPTTLLALDATIVVQGKGGERSIAAADFFTGFLETALTEDEIITQIRVPKTNGAGWAYLKFTTRALDWATVGVAAVVTKNGSGIGSARIALTNMGSTPIRASAAEAAMVGASGDGIASAAEKAAEETSPSSDTFASADFRTHLAQVLTKRAVEEALSK